MGSDPTQSHLEQAKQHLREAATDNHEPGWHQRQTQSLIWAVDEVIRHIEGRDDDQSR